MKEAGLATIHDLTGQATTNEHNKRLDGEDAIEFEIPRMKKVLEWSGLTIQQCLTYLTGNSNKHVDKIREVLKRIDSEE